MDSENIPQSKTFGDKIRSLALKNPIYIDQ